MEAAHRFFLWKSSSQRLFIAFFALRWVRNSHIRLACIISAFLNMAGIESSSGPQKQNMGDLARRMDEILTELKDTRNALSLKLDNAVKDLSIKLQVCEQQLVNQTTRLDNADLQRATMQAEIVFNLQSTPTLAVATATTPVTPPLTVNDVAHELKLRNSKETNIISSGILLSTILSDAQIVINLLLDELNVITIVTHCLRLGKHNTARPQLLLANLAHASDAMKVIRLAKSLRNSRNDDVKNNVYINPDLTHEQRTIQYNLRTELKHRKAAGETDLIIKNKRIVTAAP